MRYDMQGRSQPHSPGWARVHFPHFFLKFWSIFLIFPQNLLISFLILALLVGESPTREGPGYATDDMYDANFQHISGVARAFLGVSEPATRRTKVMKKIRKNWWKLGENNRRMRKSEKMFLSCPPGLRVWQRLWISSTSERVLNE